MKDRAGGLRDKLVAQNKKVHPRGKMGFTFWTIPVAAVALVMSLLGLSYLGGNLNPESNLNEFPVAIVNSDVGAEMVSGDFRRIGDEIETQLNEQVDDRFELRELNPEQAQTQLGTGEVYGMLQIPRDFSMQVNAWAIGAVLDNEVSQPQLTVMTNPGAGVGAMQIMEMFGETATETIDQNLGEQLLAQVQEAAEEGDFELNGVTTAAMLHPLDINFTSTDDLGDGSGAGLSALFWALLIVLAGFTGAAITNVLVDGRLGVLPAEAGPFFITTRHMGVSRLMTLLVKFGFVAIQAVVVAGLYVWIGTSMGMVPSSVPTLWFFTAMMIASVGIAAQAVTALLGHAGLVVNLLFFVAFGLPAAGATLPLQAVPPFFREIAPMMPLHQIYLGTRSILFFDGQWSAGLGSAFFWALGGALVWFVIGVAGTWLFDRWGFTRAIAEINPHLDPNPGISSRVPSRAAVSAAVASAEAERSAAESHVEGDVDSDSEDNGDSTNDGSSGDPDSADGVEEVDVEVASDGSGISEEEVSSTGTEEERER